MLGEWGVRDKFNLDEIRNMFVRLGLCLGGVSTDMSAERFEVLLKDNKSLRKNLKGHELKFRIGRVYHEEMARVKKAFLFNKEIADNFEESAGLMEKSDDETAALPETVPQRKKKKKKAKKDRKSAHSSSHKLALSLCRFGDIDNIFAGYGEEEEEEDEDNANEPPRILSPTFQQKKLQQQQQKKNKIQWEDIVAVVEGILHYVFVGIKWQLRESEEEDGGGQQAGGYRGGRGRPPTLSELLETGQVFNVGDPSALLQQMATKSGILRKMQGALTWFKKQLGIASSNSNGSPLKLIPTLNWSFESFDRCFVIPPQLFDQQAAFQIGYDRAIAIDKESLMRKLCLRVGEQNVIHTVLGGNAWRLLGMKTLLCERGCGLFRK